MCLFNLLYQLNNKSKKTFRCFDGELQQQNKARKGLNRILEKNMGTYEHFVLRTCCRKIKQSIRQPNHALKSNWRWKGNIRAQSKAKRTKTLIENLSITYINIEVQTILNSVGQKILYSISVYRFENAQNRISFDVSHTTSNNNYYKDQLTVV